MKKELKKLIIDFVFENMQTFNLVNTTVNKFRPYIYDESGAHLIGGEDVYNFIKDAVKLITIHYN